MLLAVADCATGSMQANSSADESPAAREHQDIDQQDGTAAVAGPPSGTEGGPPALAGECQRSELQRQGSGVPLSEVIAARRAAVWQAFLVGDPGEQDPTAVVPAGGAGGLQPRQPSAAQMIPAHTQPMQQPSPASAAVPRKELNRPLGLAPAFHPSSGVEVTPAPRQPAPMSQPLPAAVPGQDSWAAQADGAHPWAMPTGGGVTAQDLQRPPASDHAAHDQVNSVTVQQSGKAAEREIPAATSAPPAAVSAVRASQDGASAQLQLTRPVQRPQAAALGATTDLPAPTRYTVCCFQRAVRCLANLLLAH